jgi:hypothetical protein
VLHASRFCWKSSPSYVLNLLWDAPARKGATVMNSESTGRNEAGTDGGKWPRMIRSGIFGCCKSTNNSINGTAASRYSLDDRHLKRNTQRRLSCRKSVLKRPLYACTPTQHLWHKEQPSFHQRNVKWPSVVSLAQFDKKLTHVLGFFNGEDFNFEFA